MRIANTPNANIFAAGDVVDTPGPSLGRAAATQGMFVANNIVRAIKGKTLKTFKPGLMDWSIVLTLGLVSRWLLFFLHISPMANKTGACLGEGGNVCE